MGFLLAVGERHEVGRAANCGLRERVVAEGCGDLEPISGARGLLAAYRMGAVLGYLRLVQLTRDLAEADGVAGQRRTSGMGGQSSRAMS